jgi:parallel beta-helix repeat protein
MQTKSQLSKCLVVGIILLFIGTAIIPSSAQNIEKSSSASRGHWLYVGGSGPGNYSTIQSAVNEAFNGDTVFVYAHSSPYRETIIGYHSINLIGEDKNTTIIDGQHIGTVLTLTAGNCRVSGFSILNCHPSQSEFQYAVIKIYKNDNIIENNIVSGGEMDYGTEWGGIDLARNSNNNTVIHNQLIYNYWGWDGIVTESDSNNNNISENNITGQNNGISIQYNSNHNIISRNTIHANWNAIKNYGSYTLILNNTVSDNRWGIECDIGYHGTLSYNIIQNNEKGGLKLEHFWGGSIKTYYVVSHNIFSDNPGGGMALDTIINNIIEYNTFSNNGEDGLYLLASAETTIKNNTFSYNSGYGIYLATSSVATVENNTFSNNGNIGLYLDASVDTSIHHNNFVNNSKYNAYFQQNSNHNNWNGNYWSNSPPHGLSPTIIHGKRTWIFFSYPWFNVDWHPAQKPFDIGG